MNHTRALSSSDSSDDIAATFKPKKRITKKYDFDAGSSSDNCFDSTDDEHEIQKAMAKSQKDQFDEILRTHDSANCSANMAKNVELFKRKSLALPESKPTVRLRALSENHGQGGKKGIKLISGTDEEYLEEDDNDIYLKYLDMKKKYKKQRRISKQFEKAITSIQDDNEEVLNETETQLKEQYEQEYDLKMMRLETQKLGDSMKSKEQLSHLMSENAKLIEHNKLLQRQVTNQATTMSIQHQLMRRSFSNASVLSLSPLGSNETIENIETTNNINSEESNDDDDADNDDDVDRGYVYQNGYHINTDLYNSNNSSNSTQNEGQLNNCSDTFNMEPAKKYNANNDGNNSNPYQSRIIKKRKNRRNKIKKRKFQNYRDFENKLIKHDDGAKNVGLGLTGWEKFVLLITPSVCSCSPPAHALHTNTSSFAE